MIEVYKVDHLQQPCGLVARATVIYSRKVMSSIPTQGPVSQKSRNFTGATIPFISLQN